MVWCGLGERERVRRRTRRAATSVALLVSLAVHLAILALWPAAPLGGSMTQRVTRVRLVQLSRAAWMRNRAARDAPADHRESRPERQVAKRDTTKPPGQVVALPPPEKSERPERARYASEYDRTVERETRSRYQTPYYLNPTERPQVGTPERRERPSASQQKRAVAVVVEERRRGGPAGRGRARSGRGEERSRGQRARGSKFELPRIARRDALHLKLDEELGTLRNRTYSEELPGKGRKLALALERLLGERGRADASEPEGARGGDGSDESASGTVLPDPRDLERLSGAPANDHLPDVEEDEATRLNTRRWMHAPFFNRVAESVRREWHPDLVLARRDPSGEIYGFRDRTTVLRVTIDRRGGLAGVSVARSSGLDFLDREAVLAFRRAEPFVNPPEQLFADGPTYTFYFGFNVDFERPSLIQFRWRPYP